MVAPSLISPQHVYSLQDQKTETACLERFGQDCLNGLSSQSSVSSCSLLLWVKQTGSGETWYCWGSWEQGNCQLWQISTHKAARLRLRGTADICSPRECLDARLGSTRAGEGEVNRARGLEESFLVENQEKAFSWGNKPLLGIVCHPHLAAGKHGYRKPTWMDTVSDDKG